MLTLEEMNFLASQNIGADEVFDGRNCSKSLAADQAKRLGKRLVLGSPCTNGAHRLRTRSGHCVQCDTRRIAYEGRYSTAGYVYIAGSLKGRVTKIGTTKNLDKRQSSLLAEEYGGYSDWELLMSVRVPEAGRVEQEAIQGLSRFRVQSTYTKDRKSQKTYEILSCGFTQALVAIVEAIGVGENSEAWRSHKWKIYDFNQP